MVTEKFMKLTVQEITRKLLHIVALLMPACILYFPAEAPLILGVLLVGMVAIEWLRFHKPAIQDRFLACFGIMLRREEDRIVTGATWIILSAFILSLLFRSQPRFAAMALVLFVLGDSAAALVGMTMGKIHIGRKTLEGSLACFFTCLILQYALFPFLPAMNAASLRPLTIWVSALVVTVGELIPITVRGYPINDNLVVPLIAATVMGFLESMR